METKKIISQYMATPSLKMNCETNTLHLTTPEAYHQLITDSPHSAGENPGAEPVSLFSATLREKQGHETDRSAAAQPKVLPIVKTKNRLL